MRPRVCVPIVDSLRRRITDRARELRELPIQMVEWRVDYYAGYEAEVRSIVKELKEILEDKELIVTLRTEYEGGEKNGSRFDYFGMIEGVLQDGAADYVDVEIERDEKWLSKISHPYRESHTGIIGSFHDFDKTPEKDSILGILEKSKELGCRMGKIACMPHCEEDVDTVLMATKQMRENHPEYPIITMSMGALGSRSRLYGGLYGSEVSFGCEQEQSAPGQMDVHEMLRVFDKIYAGKKHIILIGFMGVGKTCISKELSSQTQKPEIDTDAWIEKNEGRSIREIFEEDGEEYFRRVETNLIDELGEQPPSIVSCGGGMALREINVRKLQALGEVVLLTAKPDTIYERVKDDTGRPLLQGNKNVAFIEKLMSERQPYYERAATKCVATDQRPVEDIAKEILEKCNQI